MASVSFEGVSKRYGDFTAVSDLNLEVADREFLVLLGPSGCGKTTTMRMIAGLEQLSAGTLRIGEDIVNDVLPKYRDVAMVFQSYALYPHLSVYRNIEYPLRIRKVPDAERRRAVEAAAAKVALTPFLDRLPKQLSGGQRQRVALARAIIRRPRVFLMDEPLSNLDAKLRVHMRAELKHLQHELAVTTVYVTHDQIEAMTLADRVAVMHDGVIRQLGTPREIYNDPANLFVAGFIGSPAMNFLRGSLAAGTFEGRGARVPGLPFGDNPDVVLGVRPEDLAVVPGNGQAHMTGTIFSVELTGESTLVTLRIGEDLVSVRADKEFDAAIDAPAGIRINERKAFLFDRASEERVRH
jgi:multiple sugar transport system ATP-binding protein